MTNTSTKNKPPRTARHNKVAKTPRQQAFKAYYTDPDSPTQGNALQSARRAGYSESYANNITGHSGHGEGIRWLNNDVFRSDMLAKAEQRLNEYITTDVDKHDKDGRKLQQDTVKFVAERVGKRHYSAKIEQETSLNVNLFKNDHPNMVRGVFEVID